MLYKVKGGEYLDQAEQLHTSALMIFEKHYGRYHEKVALTLNLLAEVARKKVWPRARVSCLVSATFTCRAATNMMGLKDSIFAHCRLTKRPLAESIPR